MAEGGAAQSWAVLAARVIYRVSCGFFSKAVVPISKVIGGNHRIAAI